MQMLNSQKIRELVEGDLDEVRDISKKQTIIVILNYFLQKSLISLTEQQRTSNSVINIENLYHQTHLGAQKMQPM